MQCESDAGWTKSQVKRLLKTVICVYCSTDYCKKKKKKKREIKISGRVCDFRKPGKTQAEPSLFSSAAGVFSLTTTMWVVVDTGSVQNPDSLWQKYHTDTHTTTLAFILAFLLLAFATHTHTHTHMHRPSTHVSRGLFVQSIPAWHFHSTLKSPPSRRSCAPPSTHPLGRRRGSYLLYRVCFDSTVSIQWRPQVLSSEFVIVLYACPFEVPGNQAHFHWETPSSDSVLHRHPSSRGFHDPWTLPGQSVL